MDIVSWLDPTIKKYSFARHAIVPLGRPLSIEIYKAWLDQGHHGQMNYLEQHYKAKEDPNIQWPQAKSAIVVLQSYAHQTKSDLFESLKIARYAKGPDYHCWFKEKLTRLSQELKDQFKEHEFFCATDSSPILERDLAAKGGLGWFGKNSCLIHRQEGSFHFIGEILTSLTLTTDIQPESDFCGTCNRCIEACPTDALNVNRTLDARKCIAYWNIESRQAPPMELRPKMGDWLFGCDICQDVCPWNRKVLTTDSQPAKTDDVLQDLKWILTSSNKQIAKKIKGTPLSRSGPKGLKRSALIVLANKKMRQLAPYVEDYLKNEEFSELAHWTLSQLKTH